MEREPRRLEFAFALGLAHRAPRASRADDDGRTQMSAGAPASLPLPRRLLLSSARARCCSAGSRRTSSPADTRPLQAAAQAMGEQGLLFRRKMIFRTFPETENYRFSVFFRIFRSENDLKFKFRFSTFSDRISVFSIGNVKSVRKN